MSAGWKRQQPVSSCQRRQKPAALQRQPRVKQRIKLFRVLRWLKQGAVPRMPAVTGNQLNYFCTERQLLYSRIVNLLIGISHYHILTVAKYGTLVILAVLQILVDHFWHQKFPSPCGPDGSLLAVLAVSLAVVSLPPASGLVIGTFNSF